MIFTRNRMNHAKGVSLMEVLVVAAILTTILAIAMPSYGKYQIRVQQSAGRDFAREVISRQENYYIENLVYTTTPSDLDFPTPFRSKPAYYEAVLSQCPGPEPLSACVQVVASPVAPYDTNTMVITANTRQHWAETF